MSDDNTFKVARSDYIDACSEVEVQVVRLMQIAEIEVKSDCLGLKLKKLATVLPSPQRSKANVTEVRNVCASLEPCLAARADIVHSTLQILTLDGLKYAAFANVRQNHAQSKIYRLMTAHQLSHEARHLKELADRLAAVKWGSTPPTARPNASNSASCSNGQSVRIPIRT